MLSTSSAALRSLFSKAIGTGVVATANRAKHTLPDLPYDYNALEPYIAADIMQLHHTKHHNTYVNNLNVAEEKLAEAVATNDVSQIIQLQPALKFNGGGHLNHSIFWEVLSPKGGGEPTGDLMETIRRDFESFENMKKELSTVSVGVQGSGWGWLGYNPASGRLRIATCLNQDPLQPTTEYMLDNKVIVLGTNGGYGENHPTEDKGLIPLFGIDVWEHAYYLQYKNVRPDYVNAIWNIVNWENVSKRLQDAKMEN